MAIVFPPTPVFPYGLDSDYTLFKVYNTSESATTTDNPAWSQEIDITPVGADEFEIWGENGFANISGELFYYDSVGKDSNGKINKLKKCARNLGGSKTKFNSSGTIVRGFVIAEHHNQIVDAIINIESFLGTTPCADEDSETIICLLEELENEAECIDDNNCPSVNFEFSINEDESNNCSGIVIDYEVGIIGQFNSFRIDFGDGNFSNQQTGSHTYAPNADIDPIVTVSNNYCQIVQTPINRSDPKEPPISEVVEDFNIPINPIPDIPDILVPNNELPEQTLTLPQIIQPCLDLGNIGPLGPINIPSVISIVPPLDIPSHITIDSVEIPSGITIEIDPIDIPTLIEFGPVDIPTFIDFGDVDIPTVIEFGDFPSVVIDAVSIDFPSQIDFGPIDIPTIIEFGPVDIPTLISFTSVDIPTIIEFGPAPDISVDYGDVPSITIDYGTVPNFQIDYGSPPTLSVDFGDVPSITIDYGSPPTLSVDFGEVPSILVDWGSPPGPSVDWGTPPPISVDVDVNVSAPDISVNFGIVPSIQVVFSNVPDISVDFGDVPTIEFGSPPSIPVNWGAPPACSCTVTIECPASTPLMAQSNALTEDFEDGFDDPGEIEIEYSDIGIPSEIKILPPDIPDIRLDHSIPDKIKLDVGDFTLPEEIKIIGPDIFIPEEIKLVMSDDIPTISLDLSNLENASIKLDASEIPSIIALKLEEIPSIKLELPEDFPTKIMVEGIPDKIQVEGVPKTIELIDSIPKEIIARLEAPKDLEVPLVYKGGPIPLKLELNSDEEDGDEPCFRLVPCSPK